jgi:hypothetical protein
MSEALLVLVLAACATMVPAARSVRSTQEAPGRTPVDRRRSPR